MSFSYLSYRPRDGGAEAAGAPAARRITRLSLAKSRPSCCAALALAQVNVGNLAFDEAAKSGLTTNIPQDVLAAAKDIRVRCASVSPNLESTHSKQTICISGKPIFLKIGRAGAPGARHEHCTMPQRRRADPT